MKTIVLLISLCIIFIIPVKAQIDRFSISMGAEYMMDVKDYPWFRLDEESVYEESSLKVGIPALGFEWQGKSKWRNQIETLPFSCKMVDKLETVYAPLGYMGEQSSGYIMHSFTNYARYSAIRYIERPEEKRTTFFYGLGLTLRGRYEKFSPYTSNIFPGYDADLRISPTITAGIEFSLGEKFFLNIYLPFELLEFTYTRLHFDNPNLPQYEQTTSTFNIEALNRWSARIGFGVKL